MLTLLNFYILTYITKTNQRLDPVLAGMVIYVNHCLPALAGYDQRSFNIAI
jgi:hypothetical protein